MKKYLYGIILISLVILSHADNGTARGLSVISSVPIDTISGNTGKRYAICIGINGYEHPDIQDLSKARNDANAFGNILQEYGQFDQVFIMTDDVDPRYDQMGKYPRLRNIKERLNYLKDFINPEDLVLFSFSGHGISNDAGQGFLLVSDTDYNDVFNTSLQIQYVVDWLNALKVKKSLLIIDACREQVTETVSRGLSSNNIRAERYNEAEVSAIFYATKSGWYSYEDKNSDYGVFTKFLLEGVKGKADYQIGNRDGVVTFREISTYVEESVGSYSMEMGLKQKPYIQLNGETTGDLAISSYNASVDIQTRGVIDTDVNNSPAGPGNLNLFSNVPGNIRIDGNEAGTIKQGETRFFEDLDSGNHFLEIVHDYGVFRNDFTIFRNTTANLANIVILSEREIKTIKGINFVFIKGNRDIPDFWISETETAFKDFGLFVDKTGYQSKYSWDEHYLTNYDFYPVHNVSRDDATAYIEWFSGKTGETAALPSTAQWQYAAGGKNSTVYPWGDSWNKIYCNNSKSSLPGMLPIIDGQGPVQVQYFQRDITLDGVTNLAGNLREWCSDERVSSDGDLIGTIAGGSWKLSRTKYFKADYTSVKPVFQTAEDIGFRIVLEN